MGTVRNGRKRRGDDGCFSPLISDHDVKISGNSRIGGMTMVGCGSVIEDSSIGFGTIVGPLSFLQLSKVGNGCFIGPSSLVVDCVIHNDTCLKSQNAAPTVIECCEIMPGLTIPAGIGMNRNRIYDGDPDKRMVVHSSIELGGRLSRSGGILVGDGIEGESWSLGAVMASLDRIGSGKDYLFLTLSLVDSHNEFRPNDDGLYAREIRIETNRPNFVKVDTLLNEKNPSEWLADFILSMCSTSGVDINEDRNMLVSATEDLVVWAAKRAGIKKEKDIFNLLDT